MKQQEFEAKMRELRAERQKAIKPIQQAQFELKQEITAKGQQIHALFNDIDKLKVKKNKPGRISLKGRSRMARENQHIHARESVAS